jgi:ATP-dependent DNA helicase RecG
VLITPLSKALRTTTAKIKILKKMGLETVQDLLMYYPRTYEDKSRLVPVSYFSVKETNNAVGILSAIRGERTRNGKFIQKATFTDDEGGSCECVWFNQQFLTQMWSKEQRVLISGKAKYNYGKMSLVSPEVEKYSEHAIHTGSIVPVYTETEGISSKWLREKIQSVLPYCEMLVDVLPDEVREQHFYPTKAKSVMTVHQPESDEKLDLAQSMLAFEELFILQLNALEQKRRWQTQGSAPKIGMDSELIKKFQSTLPYELTGAQKICLFQILKDMEKGEPMLRLLEGDVGSGKTVVAAMAMMSVVKAGYQCALMSPTEILTKQHFENLRELLQDLRIELLVGSMQEKDKKNVRENLLLGLTDVVIGTHALIQDSVQFQNLGLAVIDEQHRFGVDQRARLIKGLGQETVPHLLMMSATPIPRTLALTIYGDQELSVIDEMPPGRKPITTKVVHQKARQQANLFIDSEIGKGRQVFVVCPLVDESEKLGLEVKSVLKEVQYLDEVVFKHRSVAYLHGKMASDDKDRIMNDFKEKKYDILVATSVVEVGIDIPNASIMLIEGAERFGLSQLHQFRGRVGRGADKSYCFLFTTESDQLNNRRLKAMELYSDGFKLAEIDLEIRGPGEVYGYRQSGLPDLRMASIMDGRTIALARKTAKQLLDRDPELREHKSLRLLVDQRQSEFVQA